MKFRLICTHNPQDFFNGDEPIELAKVYETDNLNDAIAREIMNGYKVIVTMLDADN
jgi:hypothetical protein